MTDFLGIEDADLLESPVVSLRLEVHTASAPSASTLSAVYCNVVFDDGSLLFDPTNHRLVPSVPFLLSFFARNSTHVFELPIPGGVTKRVADIAEFYIRKAGSDGWLLGSALLFPNGSSKPLMGNTQINQFLDNDEHTLFITDWSTRSLCEASSVSAKYPLLSPQYRIAGPVLGHLSDHTARILYRVDREGVYRLTVTDVASGAVVFTQARTLAPTATFDVRSLAPDTHYRFTLHHAYLGQNIPVPQADGELRTFPREDVGVRFSLAFGSCARNRYDVAQNAWTRIRNLAADAAVSTETLDPPRNVRFFVHLGDTFYFYDDVTSSEPRNLRTVLAAHLSQRRHPRFLDMARVLPSCAVWDDHDFGGNNSDGAGLDAREHALTGFLRYWGNAPLGPSFGFPENLTTLITYGNVDLYLLDGRFHRDKDAGICFGKKEQLDSVIGLIRARLKITGIRRRLVILASGSTWNHTVTDGKKEAYGNSAFAEEREAFYGELNALIREEIITGLVFLSGDVHINEIYEIRLESATGPPRVVAPEFVCSPLGRNSDLKGARSEVGERKKSHSSKTNGRGFATLEIDTRAEDPAAWRISVRYYEANASVAGAYMSQSYELHDRQFPFAEQS